MNAFLQRCCRFIPLTTFLWAPFCTAKSTTPVDIAQRLGWQANSAGSLCSGHFPNPKLPPSSSRPIKQSITNIRSGGPDTFTDDGTSILRNQVDIQQQHRHLQAQTARVTRDDAGHIRRIQLSGSVRYHGIGHFIVADQMTLWLPSQRADMHQLLFRLSDTPSPSKPIPQQRWGKAEQAMQDSHGIITFKHASVSSCYPNKPAWSLSSQELRIDRQNGTATAHNTTLRFHGIPLLWTPYYHFAIDGQAHSGFLTPTLTNNNNSGFIISLPFYWHARPDADLTITPEWLTKRGFEWGLKARADKPHFHTELQWHQLPYDRAVADEKSIGHTQINNSNADAATKQRYRDNLNDMGNSRYHVQFAQSMSVNPHIHMALTVNRVSDDYIFRDLDQLGAAADTNQLRNEFLLSYQYPHWFGHLQAQDFQTLQRFDQPDFTVLSPFQRLPELTAHGSYHELGGSDLDLDIDASADYFTMTGSPLPKQPSGAREHLRPTLSWHLHNSSTRLTPEISLDARAYQQRLRSNAAMPKQADLVIPISRINLQKDFVRYFTWRHSNWFNQLTPQLQYLYVPYRQQRTLPNYDSYNMPFQFNTLFLANRFSGFDRLQNANQLSMAVTDQLYNAQGHTVLSAGLGMAWYFDKQRVCAGYDNCTPNPAHRSPLSAQVNFALSKQWLLSAESSWDTENSDFASAVFSIGYTSGQQAQFNLQYRYVPASKNPLFNNDLSNPLLTNSATNRLAAGGQWSLSRHWQGLLMADYDFDNKRINNYTVGLQYNACCWQLQLMLRRSYISQVFDSAQQQQNHFNTGIYFNLVLTGLGDVGNTVAIHHVVDKTKPGTPLIL